MQNIKILKIFKFGIFIAKKVIEKFKKQIIIQWRFLMGKNVVEAKVYEPELYEPELYCLRCQYMEWNEQKRVCANFEQEACPLLIRDVLAKFEVTCLVV